MMMLAPWLAWLAAIASLVLLVARSVDGETQRSRLAMLWVWFTAALYAQFYGGTAVINAAGLAAQTLLAISLLVWWKLES